MQSDNNLINVLNKTESFFKEKASGLFGGVGGDSGIGFSSILSSSSSTTTTTKKRTIVYDLSISKSGKIRNTFELKTFLYAQPSSSSSSSSELYNLSRLLTLIDIDLLRDEHGNENEDFKTMLNTVSTLMNQLKREKSKKDKEDEHLCYIALLKVMNCHFYNNQNLSHYLPLHKNGSSKVSSDLFSFEYMMSLFTLACYYITKGNEAFKSGITTKSQRSFKDSIDVLNEMISFINSKGEEEEEHESWQNTFKFLYIKSPDNISSSSSSSLLTKLHVKKHILTKKGVEDDFSMVLDDFGGGKDALYMLIDIIKAQRFRVLYSHACKKIGMSDDLMVSIKEGEEGFTDLYTQIFQLSASTLACYESARDRHLHLTYHFQDKTRLYYYILFITHLWYCQHHYHVALFDEYQYSCTFQVSHAQQGLVRIKNVVDKINDFIGNALYTVDDNDEDKRLVSNIISGSLLSRYHTIKKETTLLYYRLDTIVYQINSTSTANIILHEIPLYIIPKEESTLRMKMQNSLDTQLNGLSKLIIILYDQLNTVKERFFYGKNDNSMTATMTTTTMITTPLDLKSMKWMEIGKIDGKLEERTELLTILSKYYDSERQVFALNWDQFNSIVKGM